MVLMEKMLQDKVSIITGSGRGIGRAAALLYARQGAKVVVNDMDERPARETAEDIENGGGECIAVVGDVSDPSFAEGIVAQAMETWGGLHILVNNAGFYWDAPIHRMTDKQWETMVSVNLTAPFRLIRAAAPYFRDTALQEKAEGTAVNRKIINTSSVVALQGNALQTNYASAKAGLIGMTRSLAKEWGGFNIQVNAIAYGWIDTRLTAKMGSAESIEREGYNIPLGMPAGMHDLMPVLIPSGRAGTPEEAAGPMLFLASSLSNYVSGQCLEVSGGM
jgi:3-oxoacyl-[acyl-carrier protein] reductase